MRFWVSAVCFALVVAVIGLNGFEAAGQGKKKIPTKQVMKVAMKGGLCAKVAKGDATEKQKKQLLALFTALSKNSPPEGSKESWEAKTSALVAAAKAAVAGDEGAGEKLKKAANCKACHDVHKG